MVDVNMPGMNGLTACRALRAQAAASGRDIAVWLMTGAPTAELTISALDAGACGVLPKPFEFADLFERFEERFGVTPSSPAEPAV